MKTTSEKLKEVIEIYNQLKELGISDELCPDLIKFRQIANDFIKNNDTTSNGSLSGKIKLYEINRELVYLLSIQPNIKSYAYLKYKEFH